MKRIALTALISRIANNIILTLSPVIAKIDYHFPLGSLGIIEAIVLVSIIISMLSINLIYSREILLLSFILLSVSLILLNMHNVSIFFLSLILAGTSFGVIIPSMTTIASSIADDYHSNARLLKMYTFGLSIGAVISALLEAVSLGNPIFLLMAISALNLYNAYFYYLNFRNKAKKSMISFRIIFNKKLWIANMISLPYDIPVAFINVYLALLAHYYYHVSISLGFLYFFVFLLVASLSRYLIYRLELEESKMRIFSAVMTILGSILLMVNNPFFLLFGIIFLGFPHGLLLTLSSLVIAREFKDEKDKNLANSINLLFHYAVFIITPLIIGLFINISIFYGILAFVVLSIGSSLLLMSKNNYKA